ncbi:putative selenium-dependent hydroxylase accessory protein YqeC [Proteiniclasticum sp. SCR006]|uniref:Selenium-dependent hydroxylase accessory protein YqeC n=1 Tax=Proteiniclasticum aestuarii TaxID=2817862 RepID=A0A939KHQ0_9CLOT|nr:selenium cofactor biosynthesis protein YqeC [Proteiniclasticum aestuarii]MBO1265739.1 putative selenium-dependent hydroxylase accessory protein YqeC [Proteiniclasticum aestuarii]
MLHEILKLDKYPNVSLVGAGGKTTLINKLTESLRKKKKILVSSTTTFIKPEITMYDFMDYAYHKDYDLGSINRPGIYIIGKGKNLEDLVFGLSTDDIENLADGFDHTIIECDFSNGRPLKGFRDHEPKIPSTTDITIGVLDIQSLGLVVNAANIHHLDKYLELTGSSIGSLVTIGHLAKIVNDKMALFKNAVGKKVLYINKVEKEMDEALALNLFETIDLSDIDLVIEGSLIEDRYFVLYEKQY